MIRRPHFAPASAREGLDYRMRFTRVMSSRSTSPPLRCPARLVSTIRDRD